jgi:hypothetical protein
MGVSNEYQQVKLELSINLITIAKIWDEIRKSITPIELGSFA